MENKKWYIVQAHSNVEKKVVEAIKDRADKAGITKNFEEIMVPAQEVIEVRRGKKIKAERKLFPGYILVKANMNDEVINLIKKTPRVSGFPGVKGLLSKPMPISNEEVDRIMNHLSQKAADQQRAIEFAIGENVRVSDGPFASFSGHVDEVDNDRARLKVLVSIFGRATPVSLDFNQVEKIT